MANWYSNAKNSPNRATRPYISTRSAYSNLTEKERAVRQQARMVKTAESYGFGVDPVGGANTMMSGAMNFFSPQLSTDFLELPQSLRERREIYRHFYNSDPIVGQAIDLHTELPLSKIRLGSPKPTTHPEGFESADEYGKYILQFYELMCKRIKLFQRLVTLVHHYWLDGGGVLFAEDSDVEVPQNIGYEKQQIKEAVLLKDGKTEERDKDTWVERSDKEDQELIYYQKKYQGWERLVILPIDQVKMTTYSFTDKMRVELIPSERDRQVIEQAKMGDPVAEEMAEEIPHEVREHIEHGRNIPLGTDPNEGSFVYYLAARRAAGEELGNSILNRCHIPGTKVTALREGRFQQIPIECLDPGTDSVLTHNGVWKRFERGSRPYVGEIRSIAFEGLPEPVSTTLDHKYRVLRKGEMREVEAQEVVPGDKVQVAGAPVTGKVTRIDILEFLRALVDVEKCKLKASENGEVSVTVSYMRETQLALAQRNKVNSILDWLRSFKRQKTVRGDQFYSKFGLTSGAAINKTLAMLREMGAVIQVHDRLDLSDPNHDILFDPYRGKLVTEIPIRTQTFPRFLNLTEDVGYTIGYYLIQGDIAEHSEKCVLGMKFRSDLPETDLAKIRQTSESIGAVWEENLWDGNVVLSHDVFLRWVGINFGGSRNEKRLPHWIFEASRDFLSGILSGAIAACGGSSRVVTGFQDLAYQMFVVATSLGIRANLENHSKALLPGSPISSYYIVDCSKKAEDFNGSLYYEVLSVDGNLYDGSVYSLNVHDDHTFFANGALTCNCLRCHIPGTPVLVKRSGSISQVPIETLNPETDRVLTHTGQWREFEVGVRSADEDVTILHVAKLHPPVACTEDHKHFVLRDGNIIEVLARDIRPGDALQVPQVPLRETYQRALDKVSEEGFNLDADHGYFAGFWLGDGDLTKVLVTSYASALDTLTQWVAENFGSASEDKHLPKWIFDAPRPFLLGLLRGFCDSGGGVIFKKEGSISVRFDSTNSTLMEQVFLICTSLGIPASKTLEKSTCYVHFTHGPSVKAFFESGFLAKRKEPSVWKDGRSGSRHVEHDGKLFYRVCEVGSAHHTGPVYSLNVHEDHTFFVGSTLTRNCLYYREKLRQAQTQIASRAMTPRRIVWAEGLSDAQVDELREQVDLALVDPDYSIVCNYELHWEEMSSRDRLLDLSGEYEQTERQLLTGLGVTESLMSGESLYSGDRLKLEVINTRYMFLRDVLQEMVEEYLFKPVSRRKGFVEKDKWGFERVLYPRLSFTRLPLRDSQDTYDALFNLYQKGSLDISVILDLLNIDSVDTREKLEKDMFTVNDSTFNEVMRTVYGEAGRTLVEKTDVTDRIAKYLGVKMNAVPAEEGGRF